MKTKFLAAALFAAVIGTLGLSSCKKEVIELPLEQTIVGKWNFTSFKLDTSEYMGTLVDSAYIEYKALTDGKREFTQLVAFVDDDADVISGDYIVNSSTNNVTMTTEVKIITSKVTIKDDKMEWVSTQDGKNLIIKAEKQ